MRNDNILAAEMGKEAPHYLYDMNELKSKV
jgi:hypothetical protein